MTLGLLRIKKSFGHSRQEAVNTHVHKAGTNEGGREGPILLQIHSGVFTFKHYV